MAKTLQQALFGPSAAKAELNAVVDSERPDADAPASDPLLDGMVGEMFWFTIPSALRVVRGVVEDAYEQAGIDRRFLPPEVRLPDAFRRATQDLATTAEVKDDDGKKRRVALLMREVATDASRVVRQLVVEVRDEAHVRLIYEPCAQFELWKSSGRASADAMDGMDSVPAAATDLVRKAMDRFRAAWPDATKFLDDGHIRRAVDGLMTAEKVIDLRHNGGLYFALRAHASVVRQIETLFDVLKGAGAEDAAFCSAPLVDRARQRGTVADAAMRQVTGDAQSLQRAIVKIIEEAQEGRKVRKETAHSYMTELKRLHDLAEEYRGATRDALAGAAAALEVLKTEVVSLMTVAE